MPQTFPSKCQGSYETATKSRALKIFLFSSQLSLSAAQFPGKLNYKVLGLGSLREYVASHSTSVPLWDGVKIRAITLKNLPSWFSGSQSTQASKNQAKQMPIRNSLEGEFGNFCQ